jgi:hypothetical protein
MVGPCGYRYGAGHCETHEPELVPLDLNRFVPETPQQDPVCTVSALVPGEDPVGRTDVAHRSTTAANASTFKTSAWFPGLHPHGTYQGM